MAKTNTGLVRYAKSQLGNPYWYGTYGQTATEALYLGKKKQYPLYYTAKDFPSQYGRRVHDCSGLIKGYMMSEGKGEPVYNRAYDRNANGLRKACTETGDIRTIPEIPGLLVFYNGHVGVYIGNGEVIEARGHAYGVVKTKLKDRPWMWWGKAPDVKYVSTATAQKTEKRVPVTVLQAESGSEGEAVRTVQRLLCALKYEAGACDGVFGSKTLKAVKAFQTDKHLKADGIVGEKTWSALINGE